MNEIPQNLVRSAPHNIEAEQQLLGAIMLNNEAALKVTGFLLPVHFYNPAHQRLFETILHLLDRGSLANAVTLKAYFEHDGSLDAVGGFKYLVDLTNDAASILDVEEYGRVIYDLAMRRSIIDIGEQMVLTAYDSKVTEPAEKQIEDAEQKLFKLAESGAPDKGFVSFARALSFSQDMINAAYSHGGLSGVTTGLMDLDRHMGGLHKSDLIILAGRPSMGKTALATCMAFNAAKAFLDSGGQEGGRVAFFSLEMSSEQLATRILAEQTGIPSEKLRKGEITQDQFVERIVPIARDLERVPLYIDDTGALSISAMRTRARRLKRTEGLDLIVVDYLQLMRPSGLQKIDNRQQEISEITQSLKALAKELDVPVLALSQLSRQVEQREDKRPQLSDLRESGAIEQDADVVMFVYREEYYLARTEPKPDTPEHATWVEAMEKVHNTAEVILGKQRHGPIGNVRLHFEPELTKFSNYSPAVY